MALCCFVLLTSVTMLTRWFLTPTMGTCTTQGCIEHAKALRAAMNESVQPCSDFYSFSCGSWKPVGRHRSVIETIFARSFDIAIQQLESNANDSDLPITQLYFQSCVAERSEYELKNDVHMFLQFKRDLGLFWPEEWRENSSVSVPPFKVLVNMTVNWNINMIFNIRAMPGYKGRPRTLFIQRGLLSPKWSLDTADETNRLVREHCEYLEAPAPTPEQLTHVRDAYQAVVNAALSFTPDPSDEAKKVLKDINERTASKKDKWHLYVNDMFFPDFNWGLDDVVMVQHPNILKNLNTLLDGNTDQSLRLGIAWALIRLTLWTITGNPRLRYQGSDIELALRRKTACLDHAASMFGLVISTRHLRATFLQQVRSYLDSVFENVKSQYRKDFADAAWIDDQVKTKLKVKMSENLNLDSLPGSAFFSKFTTGPLYKAFPKESGSFFENFIHLAKAFRKKLASDEFVTTFSKTLGDGRVATSYSYYYNSVYFAVGALEPPLFHVDGTFAITYGSLGTLLATSMARAFDDRGITYDKGEESPWWSSDRDAYNERFKCDLKAKASRSGDDAARASSLWLPVLGLRASYAAYRAAIKAEGLVEVFRLKGLEKYTDEQVFFITYCHMTCAEGSNGDECNVPVRQSRKFAYVFQCADDAPMNPKERCPFI
ncbi:endothelin-converting enzyme 2-like [Dermacentor variabilis]|uniref:endothelin-converting enzyme 2-like n=1 Tax=Dermacentor variabilis TaxID=34621 RepID=UPI003F5B2DC2